MDFLENVLSNNLFLSKILRKIKIYADCVRLKEVILIGGVTFIGLVYSTNQSFSLDILLKWVLAMLVAYSLLAHAFLANDWSGYQYDLNDPNKQNRPHLNGDISINEIKFLSLFLVGLSLLFAFTLPYQSFLMTLGVIILNYLYSGRRVFLKSVPIASTFLHILGATFMFLIGYAYDGDFNWRGILVGLYFGLIYASGHLNHEITDVDSDKEAGINTSANTFGKKKMFITSFILFSFSFFYVFYLCLLGFLSSFLIWGILASYLAYVFFFIKTLKSDLNYKSMISFRRSYRFIFLFWGILLVFSIVFG